MVMTHYMDICMASPFMLVLFMALPMFLAECYVVSEMFILLRGQAASKTRLDTFNALSIYIAAAVITLLSVFMLCEALSVPASEWRGWVDVTASASYVLASLPVVWVALIQAGFVMKETPSKGRIATAVSGMVVYLLLAHAAMVFGMFDPSAFGYAPSSGMHVMSHTGHAVNRSDDVPQGMHRMPDGTLMKNGSSKPSDDHCQHK